MAISFRFTPVKRETSKKSTTLIKKSPIAGRGLSSAQFIREASSLADDTPPPEDAVLLAKAWEVSPERTVCALAECGYAPKGIAEKLGYRSDDPVFMKLLRDSQDFLKAEICEHLTAEIPEEYPIEVIDSDGVTHTIDVARKLKKAIVKTLFDSKSNSVEFSAMKGAQVSTEFGDIFNMAIEDVRKQKSMVRTAYARIFRTRDTGGPGSAAGRPLAPALAKLGVVAATAAPTEMPTVATVEAPTEALTVATPEAPAAETTETAAV